MDLRKELTKRINTRTKPPGSLGKLEKTALRAGLVQGTLTPELRNPTIIVFAADHGIAEAGVSPYPPEVTKQMVINILNGGAAINVFTRQNGIALRVVDAGVAGMTAGMPGLIDARIGGGTGNMLKEPAMSLRECREALDAGREIVRMEATAGCNIIGFGEMGIGNSSSASLLHHRFTGLPLSRCVGRGAGMSDEGLQRKKRILKTVNEKYDPVSPEEILATFGGFEIAMICGAVLEAKKQNMLIIADGYIATSAFLAAHAMQSDIPDNIIFSHVSDETGHAPMIEYLKGDPLLRLGMRLGEGTGAAIAYPLIHSAVLFLNEMASFESASVSEAVN
ncbi:MAG: nicotinate-nucleotide--dimethylbenzimidazole phosphoribosyltransferase [Bacteroidales bacterium]|nr:nicotinate-nucleotide--dimethylbenzimidazole phosphoribosyltransferase [Bacteroidales bacterium]